LFDINFMFSIALALISFLTFKKEKIKLSLFLLFFSSLALGIFVVGLDSFLNLWDEQYHALVAKNLISNPFQPVLIEQPLIVTNDWINANIWLHKQPLFLWQMAISIKIFGLNEFAVRFPSVLMHSLLVFFIYDIGKIIYSKNVGYYSALFYTFSYFCLEYLTGFYPTDHNDIAFLFYSFLSIWALFKYVNEKTIWYAILIGFFSGLAILNKWLTGLVVYASWFAIITCDFKSRLNKKEILNIIISLTVCCIIFLPWQFYCLNRFPNEFLTSMNFNYKHIIEPLEGHGGDFWFYYTAMFEQFGEGLVIPVFVISCFLFMIYKIRNSVYKIIILVTVLAIYIFFTIVKTKMYGYVITVIPFFIIAIAYCVNLILIMTEIKIKNRKLNHLLQTSLAITLTVFLFNASKLYKHHSNKEYGRYVSRLKEINEKKFFLKIKQEHGNQKCAIFNLNFTLNGYITGIFYTGYACYDFIPDKKQINDLKILGYQLLVINNSLPEYIADDNSIIKINL
jgi:4-amino-4-deoxy-L-arabinose transferase-like glycosyltransferase